MGSFGTNMYVASDETGAAWLIDPACSTPYEQQQLLKYLEANHLQITSIVATHGHLDHLWGAPWATRFFGLPVLMHEADIQMAQHMSMQYNLFGINATPEPFPIEALSPSLSEREGERFPFTVIYTPGHTQGGVCLYHPQEQVLFSGDTLFCCGYGRTDLPGGNTAQLIRSLEQLFTLPPATRVYPGHGESTTIGAEARY